MNQDKAKPLSPSPDEISETAALLTILEIGQEQVARGETYLAEEVFAEIRRTAT
jgi:hypothetical protein